MADPFAALAPELRALGGGATPEEVQGVLAYLLTQGGCTKAYTKVDGC